MAGRGHSFSSDPVHLVEGVRPQVPVICCPDEHLQVNGLLVVSNKLRGDADGEAACRYEIYTDIQPNVQIIGANTPPKLLR